MTLAGYPEKCIAAPLPPTSPKPDHLKGRSSVRKTLSAPESVKSVSQGSIDNMRHDSASNASISSHCIPEGPIDESSSEGEEKLELEEESEEESDAESLPGNQEDGFGSFDVHPMHCMPLPKQAVIFPGCKNASQMAMIAAADANIGVRQNRLIRTRLNQGELLFTCQGMTQVVPLINSEVATESCSGPLSKGISVVVIMPPKSAFLRSPSSSPASSRRPSYKGMVFGRTVSDKETPPSCQGWVFTCQTIDLPDILQALGEEGCIRNGLFRSFKLAAGKIGSGSYGSVLHATSVHKGDMVAIKELKHCTSSQALNEVNMLVKAQGEKVIKFRGCFCEFTEAPNPRWFLIFDFYPYGDLYDRVANCTRMTEKDAMPMVRDLCEALRHLHEQQIFHRDVKPENLLIAGGRQKGLVLTDFGISTLVTNQAEMKKTIGTVGYASPEMLKGEATSWHGDAFGVGIVLYFMLSKSTPFLAPSTKLMVQLTEDCKVNTKYACFENVSDDCKNLILNFLKKDVEERLSVEAALKSRIIRKTYVTATEPALARMAESGTRRSASKQAEKHEVEDKPVKPKHHMIALTAGELPELTRLHK